MTRKSPWALRAIALLAAFAVGIGLAPFAPLTRAAAATSALQLDIRFGGNFNVGNDYTAGSDETMSGTVTRRAGGESLDPTKGIVLGGGTQGLSFVPNGFTLGDPDISQGFVAELKFTPQSAQANMGTLFGIGGNFTVRYESGKLRTLFDANTNGNWSKHIVDAPIPSANVEHIISLAYIPTTNGTQLGSHVMVYLDGQQLSELKVPDKRPRISTSAVAPIGIGNDVHPAALDRGYKGSIGAIRVATTDDAFDPAQFVLQQVSYVTTYLKTSFSGTLSGNAYTAGTGETVNGPFNLVNGTLDDGRLTLNGTGSAATFDATAVGGLNQSLTSEVLVAPELLTAGGTLIDVMGAIQVEAAGPNSVKLKVGSTEKTIDLGTPASQFGINHHRITLWSNINEGGKGKVSLVRNNAVLGEAIDVTSITKVNDNVVFLSSVTGDAYGVGVATGGDVKTTIVGGPCTTATLDPAHEIDLVPGECAASVINKASAIRPHPRQADWQEAKLTAFLHYGINTYVNKEWSHGDEPVSVFNPTGLDTDQWAKVLAENGFKYAVLTVKHHDGFVLYPSRYTDYGIKSSPSKQDVLGKLSVSLKKYGIKLGVYLSPSDWSQYRKGVFANNSAKREVTIPTLVKNDDRTPETFYNYQASDYGKYFLNQLYETLTQYGTVDEVWFDGADGGIPNSSREVYDFPAYYDLIRKLQPTATIAVTGPDVRWVGNEHGRARPNEWGPLPVGTGQRGERQLIGVSNDTLGSNDALIAAAAQGAPRVAWWPAEVDVTMRTSGWFYRTDAGPKSLNDLRNIYYESVARNSVLLLNVPPDRIGVLRDEDANRLREWTNSLRKDFPDDLALGKPATIGGQPVTGITDGDIRSSGSLGAKTGEVVIELGSSQAIDAVVLGEAVRDHGQQITGFQVQVRTAPDTWETVVDGQAIGFFKTYRFAAKTGDAIKLKVNGARGVPHISGLSAFKSSASAVDPQEKYFVDCSAPVAGNGRTEATPINSLGQLRDLTLTPGAEVSFKRGTTCNGPLSMFGFGLDANTAQMTSYGQGAATVFSDAGAADVIAKLPDRGWEVLYNTTPPPPVSEIEVGFRGTFTGSELTYNKTEDETVNGTVARRNANTALTAEGAVINAQDQAIQANAEVVNLGTTTLNQPLVLETKFTPTADAGSVPLATLFSVGGNLALRVQAGKFRLTMDSNASGSWKTQMVEANLPELGKPHAVSMAYLPTGTATATVVVYVDGAELIRLNSNLRPSINTGAVSEIGFGNEVHPDAQAQKRGLKGAYRAIRVGVPAAEVPFSSSMFIYQPAPSTTTLTASASTYVQGSDPGVTLTATVASERPATGQVTFFEGETAVAQVALADGVATTVLPKDLASGVHNYTAKFTPADAWSVLSSTSTATSVTVSVPATATVSYTVTNSDGGALPDGATVSGTATCSVSGAKPWTATLVAGAASIELTGLVVGETCTFADSSTPVVGWTWQTAPTTETTSVTVAATNQVAFTGALAHAMFKASAEIMVLAAGGAPVDMSLSGNFTCSTNVTVPFTVSVPAGEVFGTVSVAGALPKGATCQAALADLPTAPVGWRWVGAPVSKDANALEVAADRLVHFRVSLTQESAPLAVQYRLPQAAPAALSFSGSATCDGLPSQSWTAVIESGSTEVTVPVGTAPIGVSCSFASNADPVAPAGWAWKSEMTSTDAAAAVVTASRTAHFAGSLARTDYAATVGMMVSANNAPAPETVTITGKFNCTAKGDVPWSVTVEKGATTASTTLAGALQPGDTCSSVVDPLPAAPAGWVWVGEPMSQSAGPLEVAADRSVYYLAALTRQLAPLSVAYQLDAPAPVELTFTGQATCTGLADLPWSVTIAAGSTGQTANLTPSVPVGTECAFTAAASPVAPTGWVWKSEMTSTDAAAAAVTAPRTATFKGVLAKDQIQIERIYGATVEETAAKLAKLGGFPTGKTVYLSNAMDARDALAAGPAAGSQGAPLLLTQPNVLSEPTSAALVELAPTKIVLQGGRMAISPTVEAMIKAKLPEAEVVRNSGPSALDTAVATSKNSFADKSAKVVYLANALNPADALGGSAVAGRAKSPILLVNPKSIPAVVMDELTRLGAEQVKLLGGRMALDPSLETALQKAGYQTQRLSGPSAIDTTLAVAKSAGASQQVFLVNEKATMEALATGPVAAKGNGVLLLNTPKCLQAPLSNFVTELAPKATYIVGSPQALAQPAFENLEVCS